MAIRIMQSSSVFALLMQFGKMAAAVFPNEADSSTVFREVCGILSSKCLQVVQCVQEARYYPISSDEKDGRLICLVTLINKGRLQETRPLAYGELSGHDAEDLAKFVTAFQAAGLRREGLVSFCVDEASVDGARRALSVGGDNVLRRLEQWAGQKLVAVILFGASAPVVLFKCIIWRRSVSSGPRGQSEGPSQALGSISGGYNGHVFLGRPLRRGGVENSRDIYKPLVEPVTTFAQATAILCFGARASCVRIQTPQEEPRVSQNPSVVLQAGRHGLLFQPWWMFWVWRTVPKPHWKMVPQLSKWLRSRSSCVRHWHRTQRKTAPQPMPWSGAML